jgi:hypothetical protein
LGRSIYVKIIPLKCHPYESIMMHDERLRSISDSVFQKLEYIFLVEVF